MALKKKPRVSITRKEPKERKFKGKPWVKPLQSPLVHTVASELKLQRANKNVADISYQTTLARKTVNNLLQGKTRQPNPSTMELLLKYIGKELVVRDIGSNK